MKILLRVNARAEVLKTGKNIFHARSDAFSVTNSEEELVASALVTIKATKAISEL